MREMKDSRIEWIGEIPINWSLKRLTWLADSANYSMVDGPFGSDMKNEEYVDDGVPIVQLTNIKPFSHYTEELKFITHEKHKQLHRHTAEKGDIVIAKMMPAGRACILKDIYPEYVVAADAIRFKCSPGYNKHFILYALNTYCMNECEVVSKGSTRVRISLDIARKLKLAMPPIEEQNQIASFLDSKCAEIDGLISEIQTEIATLEDYKRSVITEVVTKGLNCDTKMKDSGIEWIGMMPESWKLIRGKYTLKYLNKPVHEDDGVITCFRDGEVTLRSNRREEGFTMSDKEIGYQGIDVGDLVVHGMDGFAGAIGISDSRGKASPVLNVLDTENNKKYIMYYLRSMAYSDVFTAIATGIRVRSCDLRWNKLAELFYPIPPLEEQNEIVNYIDKQLKGSDEVIAIKRQQLETLAEYKKTVIYEYVTGKKEVV